MEHERGAADGEENTSNTTGQQKDATDKQAKKGKSSDVMKSNQALIEQLISMGIHENTAKKAVHYTSEKLADTTVEKCLDWVFSNSHSTDLSKTTLEEELGIEYIAQICPDALDLDSDSDTCDEYKMVFVINSSLNMSLGKSCAQTAHAALGISNQLMEAQFVAGYQSWLMTGQTKIVLSGNSTEHLEQLREKAKSLGLASILIQDAGRTEIPSGSKTVLAIFGSIDQVNKVTGRLRLLK